MTQLISLTDPRLLWLGAASVAHETNTAIPWRIEHKVRALFHDELANRAAMPAGVRLSFRSSTTMQAMHDQHIHYVNGLAILDADQSHLLPDDLHPNAEGYRMMAQRISELVVKPYFLFS